MSSASEGRVLTAGSINTDLVVHVRRAPERGETVTGSAFATFGGGKGANQTLASVRSGAPTSILGAVGDDDFGRQRLADLERDGVDCQSVLISDKASSGVALITIEADGDNRIAYVPGATLTIGPNQAIEAINRVRPAAIMMTLELPHETMQTPDHRRAQSWRGDHSQRHSRTSSRGVIGDSSGYPDRQRNGSARTARLGKN